MPVLPKPDDRDFTPVPQGNHVAVCYRVIDLGTQRGEYMGKENHRHKILISWEIPDEKMGDGRPFTIGQRFTWSMSEKAALRHTLESWRGRAFTDDDFGASGFDIKNIIGVGCMLNVIQEKKGDKTYSNIANVAKLPKGLTSPPPENKQAFVWLSKEEFDRVAFDGLTENLKTIIQGSPEFKGLSDREHSSDEPPLASPGDYGQREEVPF